MSEGSAGGWTRRVTQAAFVLLLVAAAARLAYELLGPLVPGLLVLVLLVVVYAAAFGGLRK